MQALQSLTLRAIAFCTALLSPLGPTASAQDAVADPNDFRRCHTLSGNLDRLECYDEATGFMPAIGSRSDRQAPMQPAPPTPYAQFLRGLLEGQTASSGARLTIVSPETMETIAVASEGTEPFDAMLRRNPEGADIYLSMIGDEEDRAENPPGLVLACEEEITQILILWTPSQQSGRMASYIYTDLRRDQPLRTEFWAIENGYVARATRGIEAIQLLRSISQADRLQILIDQTDTTSRILSFDIAKLNQNLSLLKKRCRWR